MEHKRQKMEKVQNQNKMQENLINEKKKKMLKEGRKSNIFTNKDMGRRLTQCPLNFEIRD